MPSLKPQQATTRRRFFGLLLLAIAGLLIPKWVRMTKRETRTVRARGHRSSTVVVTPEPRAVPRSEAGSQAANGSRA